LPNISKILSRSASRFGFGVNTRYSILSSQPVLLGFSSDFSGSQKWLLLYPWASLSSGFGTDSAIDISTKPRRNKEKMRRKWNSKGNEGYWLSPSVSYWGYWAIASDSSL
jgi:hypothetical protein